MAAAVWVCLVCLLAAPAAPAAPLQDKQKTPSTAHLYRVKRDTGTGTPRFRPSFGPPVQPGLAGTSYPVQYSVDTSYSVPASAEPVHTKYPAHGDYSVSQGHDVGYLEHGAGYGVAVPSFHVEEYQGFGGAWSDKSPPPPPLPPSSHRFVAPPLVFPPPPPPRGVLHPGREFHSVVNYGSISIHHGEHFEPHHNAKEESKGKDVVEILPIKSAKLGKEVETLTEKTPKMIDTRDDKEELEEKKGEVEIKENIESSAEKI